MAISQNARAEPTDVESHGPPGDPAHVESAHVESADVESLGPPGDPDEVARIVCLRMLDQRAYSRSELARALCKRGVPVDAAVRVLDRFGEIGLIDDIALAEGYAMAQHRERGLAGRAVAAKLRRRGIDDETVRTAVDQIDPDSEATAARILVERRLRSLSGFEPAVQARRLVGLLARKGYSARLAYDVVRAAVQTSAAVRGDDSGLDRLGATDDGDT